MKINKLYHMIILILLTGCNKDYVKENPSETSNAKRVTLQALEPMRDPMRMYASGMLRSEAEINLSFKTSGIVKTVKVEAGDHVRKGDLLASLDLEEIKAKVKQARNAFDKAKRDLQRVKNLYADSVATLEQKQDAETALEVAEADLNIAEFNLKHSQIIAPVSGRILSKRVEPQELVSPGQPAFVLASAGAGDQIVKVGLADKDIVKVSIGDSASITFDALPGRSYGAWISEISEASNPRTGTYNVELKLTGRYHQELKNGFVARVELFVPPDASYYKIPVTALVEADKHRATVFMTKDKNVAVKKVLDIHTINGEYFTANHMDTPSPLWLVLEGASYLNDQDSIVAIN